MSFLDGIAKHLLPGIRETVRCGARIRKNGTSQLVQCNNIFELTPGAVKPDIPICPHCEKRFNRGIVETIHARSGHITGNFHIIDGYKP